MAVDGQRSDDPRMVGGWGGEWKNGSGNGGWLGSGGMKKVPLSAKVHAGCI